MKRSPTEELEELQRLAEQRLIRVNAAFTAVVAGILAGLGLFLATNWLLVKGGSHPGPHLSLLGQYFVGYDVTFAGSLIGFAYAFVAAAALVYLGAVLYNWVAELRHGTSPADR